MPSKALYELAIQFRKAACWEYLFEDELFAIPMQDGEVGYCCVMGRLGEHFSLVVYPGEPGLATYRSLATQPKDSLSMEAMEHMFSQDCIAVSFEAKADIPPNGLSEISGHGLKPRGRNAYPLFQRMRPGCYPWNLDDPADEGVMAAALRAGLDVSRRLSSRSWRQEGLLDGPENMDAAAVLGFTDGPPYNRSIPLITENPDGSFTWGTTPLPEPLEDIYPSPVLANDLLIARVKKTARTGIWACARLMYPSAVAEGEEDVDGNVHDPEQAPYFPALLLTVDTTDGMVIARTIVRPDADAPLTLATGLAEAMGEQGRPSKILVPDARTFALLSTAMAQVGVPVERSDDLPELDEAKKTLFESIQDENPDEAELEELLDMMGPVFESEKMPAELLKELRKLRDEGALPEPLARMIDAAREDESASEAPVRPMAKESATSYVISVSLGKGCYRHIQIDADDTLDDLHAAINDAFGFDDDHLHAFFMDNKAWSHSDAYFSSTEEDSLHTDDYSLRQVGLHRGMTFKYVFDFGNEWMFQCKVLRVVDEVTETPKVLRSVGDAPEQYPDIDEEDDEENEDVSLEMYDKETLKALYEELALPKDTQELLHRYFAAFANLYGILSLRKALEIYNQQNEPIAEADFAAFAEIVRHDAGCLYNILGQDDLFADEQAGDPMDREIIIDYLLIDDDEYDETKGKQRGNPYYLPEKDVLLRYADNRYFEKNPTYEALRNFLHRELKVSLESADDIAQNMQVPASMGEEDFSYVIWEAKRIGAPLDTAEQLSRFMPYYVDMANDTRRVALRGHTPNEMKVFQRTGRNDPCPCGSGKKFKKCCGRES